MVNQSQGEKQKHLSRMELSANTWIDNKVKLVFKSK
jgi:hypothetical protein